MNAVQPFGMWNASAAPEKRIIPLRDDRDLVGSRQAERDVVDTTGLVLGNAVDATRSAVDCVEAAVGTREHRGLNLDWSRFEPLYEGRMLLSGGVRDPVVARSTRRLSVSYYRAVPGAACSGAI